MPIYVYRCESCNKQEEHIRKFSQADEPIVCESCSSQMKRVPLQNTSFQLQGSGWYRDGYSSKK